MATQSVIDELVVKLTLDAKDYQDKDKVINNLVDKTEKKLQDVDGKRKKRDVEQKKRNDEMLKSIKSLSAGFKSLGLMLGGVFGIGSAAGAVAAVAAFANMETGLRKAAVSTGLSNREMQAWGATARRLGADAGSGAQAIAALAREQKQFNLTGNAPTIQAFARLGVRTGPNVGVEDILAQAQQIYRQAPLAQRGQIESGLAAQGVSDDLIVALKSDRDVSTEFARSLGESATENRKALDSVTDTLSGVKNAAAGVANLLATVFQPQIQQLSDVADRGAISLSELADRTTQLGGGFDGFTKALDERTPVLAEALRVAAAGLKIFGQAVDIDAYFLKELFSGGKALFNWADSKVGKLLGTGQAHPLRDAVSTVGDALAWAWNNMAEKAEKEGPLNLAGPSPAKKALPSVSGAGARVSAKDIMTQLVSNFDLSVPQAAAVAANLMRESAGAPGALNREGGGTGAHGLAQWRGPRAEAFQKRYGILPDKASVEQQLQFMMTDPYERKLVDMALNTTGGARDLGERFSQVFEGHGKLAEDAMRGNEAQRLANSFNATAAPGAPPPGQQISIQTMTVVADSPREFAGALERQTGAQNYNSGIR